MKRRVTISRTVLHDACDYTPYQGLEVTGHLTRERSSFAAPLGRLVTEFESAGPPG